jgi:hypothetical protein
MINTSKADFGFGIGVDGSFSYGYKSGPIVVTPIIKLDNNIDTTNKNAIVETKTNEETEITKKDDERIQVIFVVVCAVIILFLILMVVI